MPKSTTHVREASYALFIIALLLPGIAIATGKDCEQGADTMDQVRACIYDQNEQAVDQAYQQLLKQMQSKHADAAKLLQQSQKSWAQFAQDTCSFQAAFNPKDMMQGDARVNCWTEFSQARVRILKSWETQLDAEKPAPP